MHVLISCVSSDRSCSFLLLDSDVGDLPAFDQQLLNVVRKPLRASPEGELISPRGVPVSVAQRVTVEERFQQVGRKLFEFFR